MPKPNRPHRLTRPIGYTGSKWLLARHILKIIRNIPHWAYVEPFFGSGAVLLNKPASWSTLEVANDLDGAVVNFYRVLRDGGDSLVNAILATPLHEAEYKVAFAQHKAIDYAPLLSLPTLPPLEANTPSVALPVQLSVNAAQVEAARLFWVVMSMGLHPSRGTDRNVVTQYVLNKKSNKSNSIIGNRVTLGISPQGVCTLKLNLKGIATRLRPVSFSARNALDLVAYYNSPDTLFYLDPPYLGTEHTYTTDATGEAYHKALLELIIPSTASILLSGYPNLLYATMLEGNGWERLDLNSSKRYQSLHNASGNYNLVTDCLWINPNALAHLKRKGIDTIKPAVQSRLF